jgi:hypothetical protein
MGHLLKIKCVESRVNVNILASTSVPFILTTVQVSNLALTHKKWITVYPYTTGMLKIEYPGSLFIVGLGPGPPSLLHLMGADLI